ncbi:regulatory protein MarR [Thioalkalivibrio nitratireducens DSM 14787]|uniref:Regulatory protein MarR n=1 Tax=Thioalkalivibrio nitratireducens (strain DSM 14787 / UNIQEM 213 / ALEN2) TaxID=1255043 RepID=L0DTL5_THIND|nr:winged helix-turn-helix transcriptional regulator [Thioalkalivibrio nitratireducens]AGA32340.1 regulatory protein MarR [Thioalkalivibrio nitratireducens DSM 14787]
MPDHAPAPAHAATPLHRIRAKVGEGAERSADTTTDLEPLKTLIEETRLHVLRLLAENPELTQRELAAALGISVAATRRGS